jgi:hypothetical protein
MSEADYFAVNQALATLDVLAGHANVGGSTGSLSLKNGDPFTV